jgi:hypothetical protein
MSPATPWQRWRSLSTQAQRDFVIAAALIPTVAAALRVLGFERVRTWVDRATRTPAQQRPSAIDRSVLAINRAKRYGPYPGNCLSQSLTLLWLLRRSGFSPSLQLGVRLTDSTFAAHAWVEYEGRVLNDTQDVHERYTPLTPGSVPR